MKKVFSFLISFLFSVLTSLTATFISSVLFSGNHSLLRFFRDFFIPLNFSIFLVILICVFVILASNEYLCRKGERGIPVRLYSLILKYFKIVTLINEIHEFQHMFSKALIAIKSHPGTSKYFNTIGKYALLALLTKIQQIVQMVTGTGISLNIKLFIRVNSTNTNEVTPAKNTYLRTLLRVPSVQEYKNINNNKYPERENNMKYYIGKERFLKTKNNKPQHIQKWISETINPLKERAENKEDDIWVNSAYLYMLGDREHYYISNNLVIEEKKGLYLGNCENWKNYLSIPVKVYT